MNGNLGEMALQRLYENKGLVRATVEERLKALSGEITVVDGYLRREDYTPLKVLRIYEAAYRGVRSPSVGVEEMLPRG